MKHNLVEYHIIPKTKGVLESLNRFSIICNYKDIDGEWVKEKYIATMLYNNDNFILNNIFSIADSKETLRGGLKRILDIYLNSSIDECVFKDKYIKESYVNNSSHISISNISVITKTITNNFNNIKIKLYDHIEHVVSNKLIDEIFINISECGSYKILLARDLTEELKNPIILDLVSLNDSILLDNHTGYIIINSIFNSAPLIINTIYDIDLTKKILRTI